MADMAELQKLAGQWGLTYTAGGDVDLNKETLSNLDYLKYVLEVELVAREREALAIWDMIEDADDIMTAVKESARLVLQQENAAAV